MAQWYYQKLWKLSKINTYLCQYLCISLPQGDHISDLMIIVSFFPANFVEEGYPRPQSSDRLDFKGIGPPGTKNVELIEPSSLAFGHFPIHFPHGTIPCQTPLNYTNFLFANKVCKQQLFIWLTARFVNNLTHLFFASCYLTFHFYCVCGSPRVPQFRTRRDIVRINHSDVP